MKLPVSFLAVFFIFLAPGLTFAQQSSPALTVKKLFILLDKPDNLINKENKCYAKMDGLDILKLNKPFIKEYLNHLKSTGLFSMSYLSQQNKDYQQLEKYIVKKGRTEARDSDIYTLSQDPPASKELLAVLQQSTPVISGTKATITLRFKDDPGYKLVYRLVKENNSWLIDSIGSL